MLDVVYQGCEALLRKEWSVEFQILRISVPYTSRQRKMTGMSIFGKMSVGVRRMDSRDSAYRE